jgi:enoyl-CoA hydratase/carnithine racemase
VQLETMYSKIDGARADIVLNRPQVLNCANTAWVRDLNALADDLMERREVRVLVVRGAGRAFCSGIDLTALSRSEIEMGFFRGWEAALRKLETMEPVVIAAVHSHCIGGGLQVALAADLRVAREDARFGVTAVKEGIIPGIGMWRLARFAGWGRARRLALTTEVVDAATALDWGLVDWVVPEHEFEPKIAELVERVLSMAWTSTRLTKKLTNMAPAETGVEVLEST